MVTLSKNGVGLVLFILSALGLNLTEMQLVEFISAVGTVISTSLLLWNQIARKDSWMLIFKKK
jgi:hypothetical protein